MNDEYFTDDESQCEHPVTVVSGDDIVCVVCDAHLEEVPS